MKTKSTWKLLTLALTIGVSVTACKKDKKDEPVPPTPVQAITITDLKALSTSASVTVPDNRKINGTVISDASAKNIDSKTVVLQQSTGKPGIVISFDAAQTFALGDSLEVIVSKQTLAQVNGEILLQNVPAANAKKVGTATIAARTTTIADINTNKAAWDGTLVTIPSGLFGGSSKYTGTLTYTSGNVNIKSAITAGATFENTDYPALINGLTGIVRISGNDVFLNIRNTSDVQQSQTFTMVEDFSGATQRIYSPLRSIAANQQLYSKPLVTALTTKNSNSAAEYFGAGWTINTGVGANAINVIKNLSAGSTDADATFLTTGRNYYCVMPVISASLIDQLSDPSSSRYGTEWNYFSSSISLTDGASDTHFLANLKSITIVFAGSKMRVSDFDPTSTITQDVVTNNFDAAKDGFAAYLYTSKLEKVDASTVYHNQGQWQTVTFNDIASKLNTFNADGNRRNLSLIFGSAVNQHGTFNGGISGGIPYVAGTPIVIDKIIFEYSQKPAWIQ